MTEYSAREEILADIRRALHREVKSDAPHRERVNSASSQLDRLVSDIKKNCEQLRGKLIEQFECELARVGARVHRASTVESAYRYIEQVASVRDAGGCIGWHNPFIDDMDLPKRLVGRGIKFVSEITPGELIREAAAADIGLSGVDYALADTGTLVLVARNGQPRSVSLLPPVHIAVVKPEQVLSGLSDLFPILRSESAGTDLSSAITFITGPSRTADIELTLVVGVHGPQQLHVVLLEK